MPGFQFICYSHHDGADFARRLGEALEVGTPPVHTWRDNRLSAGSGLTWQGQAGRALQECDSLLYVITRDSVRENSECWQEWNEVAKHLIKPVILIRVHDDAHAYRLEMHQRVVYRGDFDQTVEEVRAALEYAFSPLAILELSTQRLEAAKRKLSTATDPTARQRLSALVAECEVRVEQHRRAGGDLQIAADRITAALAAERSELRHATVTVPPAERPSVVNPRPTFPCLRLRGRDEELKLLRTWIDDPTCRVILIHGRPGCGKSSLACHVLDEVIARAGRSDASTPAVVYFGRQTRAITLVNLISDLSRLVNPQQVEALQTLLCDSKLDAAAKISALVNELGQSPVLVLLDDFGPSPGLALPEFEDKELNLALDTLIRLPHHQIKLIFTSRILPADVLRFNPARQRRMELSRGLNLSATGDMLGDLDPDGLLGVGHGDQSLLQDIWDKTAGNPSVIEQFVGILAADPQIIPSELLSELPEDVKNALVGESFSSLDMMTQAVFQALSICMTTYFPRVTAAGVDFILQPYFPGLDSKPLLGQLVRLYLAKRDRVLGSYSVDQIDADYALGKLNAGGSPIFNNSTSISKTGLLYRSIEYYKHLFAECGLANRLEDLYPQLAAVELYCRAGDFPGASKLLAQFDASFLLQRGYESVVVQLRDSFQGQLHEARLERYNEAILGIAYSNMGYIARSVCFHEKALQRARDTEHKAAEATELGCLAICQMEIGDMEQALDLLEQSLALTRAVDTGNVGSILSDLGLCRMALGQYPASICSLEESISLAAQAGQLDRQANRHANLALTHLASGDIQNAQSEAERAAQLAHGCPQPYFRVEAFRALAIVRLTVKDLAGARNAANEAKRDEVHLTNHAISALSGVIALLQGKASDASEAFHQAIDQSEAMLHREPKLLAALNAKGLAYTGLALLGESSCWEQAENAFHSAQLLSDAAGVKAQLSFLLKPLLALDQSEGASRIRARALGEQ